MFIVKMFEQSVNMNRETGLTRHRRSNIGKVQFRTLQEAKDFCSNVRHRAFVTEICYQSSDYTVPINVIEQLYSEMTQDIGEAERMEEYEFNRDQAAE